MSSVCFSPPSQNNGVLPALSSNLVPAPETHSFCSFNNSWGLELPHLLWGGATHASAASLFVQHMTHTFVSTCFQIAICRLWGTFQGESTVHNLSCSLWPQAFLAMFSKSKFVKWFWQAWQETQEKCIRLISIRCYQCWKSCNCVSGCWVWWGNRCGRPCCEWGQECPKRFGQKTHERQ